jgi:hypothetical protein
MYMSFIIQMYMKKHLVNSKFFFLKKNLFNAILWIEINSIYAIPKISFEHKQVKTIQRFRKNIM